MTPEQMREYKRKYSIEYKKKYPDRVKLWMYKSNQNRKNSIIYRERKLRIDSNSRMRIRMDIMEILGGPICVFCGYCQDVRALQLDHKYSDGHFDENRFKNNIDMYRHYRNHPEEAKGKLQVLCANCNSIKRHTHKEWNNIGKKL